MAKTNTVKVAEVGTVGMAGTSAKDTEKTGAVGMAGEGALGIAMSAAITSSSRISVYEHAE